MQTVRFVVVDVYALKLKVRLAGVLAIGLDAMLVGDNLPELKVFGS